MPKKGVRVKMLVYLKAERLKNKRSLVEKMLYGVPIIFVLFCLALSGLMFGGTKTDYFMAIVYNWFPTTFIPIIIALLTNQLVTREKNSGYALFFKSHDISFRKSWLAKVINTVANLGMMLLINYLLTIFLEYFFLHEQVSYWQMFKTSVVIWLCSLTLIPLSLYLVEKSAPIIVIILNFVMGIVGVVVSTTAYWWLCPWSWSARLTAPLMGIAPNGLFLQPNDPLWRTDVIFSGLLIALLSFVGLTYLTMFLYDRRKEQADD